MSTFSAILAAAYTIWIVKESIEGCGKETDIIVLSRDFPPWIHHAVTRRLSDIFEQYADLTADMFTEMQSPSRKGKISEVPPSPQSPKVDPSPPPPSPESPGGSDES